MYHLSIQNQITSVKTLGDVLRILNERVNFSIPSPAIESISLTQDGHTKVFTIVRNGYGKIGVQQEGRAEHIISGMVDEVFTNYLKPEGIVLKPHEMAKDHWNAINQVCSASYDVTPCFTRAQLQERFDSPYPEVNPGQVSTSGYVHNRFYKECGWSHNGPGYDRNGQTNSRHDVHVAYALAQGKHVPVDVIIEYRDSRISSSDLSWFRAVLDFPQLRGVMSVEKLQSLWSVLHWEKKLIDSGNVDHLLALMLQYPLEHPNTVQMDDYLYGVGELTAYAPMAPAPEAFDLSTAMSPLALKIREYIGKDRQASCIKKAQCERDAGRYSLREFNRQMDFAKSMVDRETIKWGNTVAQALAVRDVTFLLHLLDTPDAQNHSSKKAIQDMQHVKLLGLKAKARREAIFSLCAYDTEQRDNYESDLLKKAETDKFAQMSADIIELMKGFQIKSPQYGTLDVKSYVDSAVKDGYNVLHQTKDGRSYLYWLFNPNTGAGMSIKSKDGTLAYARDVLKLQEHTQAQAA